MPPKEFTSVWAREPRGQREQGLSRDQIVRAAMEILDAEGLEALSMRKLGARLGAGATSLYWHVATKDELLELAMDQAWGEIQLDPEKSWRETASDYSYGLRGTMLHHLWLGSLLGGMPSIGPQALRASATLLNAFQRGGFEGMEIDFAVNSVISYTLGATLPEIAWRTMVFRSGSTEEEQVEAMTPIIEAATAHTPELRERHREYMSGSYDPAVARNLAFDYGLVALLDGLAARLLQPDRPGSRTAQSSAVTPAESTAAQPT
ncbi:TetR/AcrR family transcriptional regulator [Acrocarpospora catenulata]|uniref:TetR/AcrR family transcriptional regulator n=1 Tax=Acrocarpospora catenulata TaxID=2836182 RepID=UPI001BD995B3|nr:TetR/AcrR family transcriptional regulator C-terminal domain-containing protein [Acrocarpospora catenulata]